MDSLGKNTSSEVLERVFSKIAGGHFGGNRHFFKYLVSSLDGTEGHSLGE